MSGKNPFLGFGFVSPFITFIRASISKMGASLDYGITSPGGEFNLRSIGSVDYMVDWGDGSPIEASTASTLPHTYVAGDYTVKVYSDSSYRPYFFEAYGTIGADASQITSVIVEEGADLGTILVGAWYGAANVTSFVCPFGKTSEVNSITAAWGESAITSFPLIDTSLVVNAGGAWWNCSSLADFPANMFDITGILVTGAFNFTWKNCALTAQSIENILVSLDTNGATGITLSIDGGTNAPRYQGTSGTTLNWSAAAEQAFNNLETKGWTISYKSYA